jgi:hypothetical protein
VEIGTRRDDVTCGEILGCSASKAQNQGRGAFHVKHLGVHDSDLSRLLSATPEANR